MSTILVLGAIAPFCDLIDDIKAIGHEIVVCDYYVDAPAKKRVTHAYDISTTDIEEISKVARKHNVEGIVSAFSDRNLLTHYKLANKLSLPIFYNKDIIELITNKKAMKEKLALNGFPIIKYTIIDRNFKENDLHSFKYPIVIKPIDSYGSKGIFICHSINDIKEKFESCIREAKLFKDTLIVEEFYPYDEISISTWVKEGKVFITCIYDVGKNFGEDVVLSRVGFPSKYEKNNMEEFNKIVQELAEAFGIKEGPMTVQCYIGPEGLKIGEILYRLAGGSPYLYPVLCGGPNTAKMLVDLCLNKEIDYQNLDIFKWNEDEYIYDMKFVVMKSCTVYYDFTEESIMKNVPECIAVIIYRTNGEKIVNVSKNGEMIVRIFCKVNDLSKVKYNSLITEIAKNVKIYDKNKANITSYILVKDIGEHELYNL